MPTEGFDNAVACHENQHDDQCRRLNEIFGMAIDHSPLALVYYDATDGTILRYNRKAEEIIKQATGLPSMVKTVFGDITKLSYIADKMRKCEEFEFFVVYDNNQHRFVPLKNIAGADSNKVLVVYNFNAVDNKGCFICNALTVHPLEESRKNVIFSELESAKASTLTKAFGMTELTFHPADLTLDAVGGRDNYNLFGAPIEQVSKLIHPDDAEYFIDQFADASVQFPESMSFIVRIYSVALKGFRYFRLMFYPQIDSLGNVLSYGGFCIDVNEEEIANRKKLEDVKNLVKKNVEQNFNGDERNIISILANITHDLRNPLGIIKGISDIMSETDDHEKRSKYNRTIQDSVDRLLGMVNEILNLNRVEFNNVEVNDHQFDLEAWLQSFTNVYTLPFTNNGITLAFKPHGKPLMVDSDDHRIAEILDNFLSNALKYTDKGKVTICYEQKGDKVSIHVIDTGVGISEEDCEKVFDRFEKLGTNKRGNGIGLHICSGLAKALGGSVGVSSQLGVGSDFWLEIPIKK